MKIDTGSKPTVIWVTQEEYDRGLHNGAIAMLPENCRTKKNRAVVFISGSKNLFECTEGLILHNRIALCKSCKEQP
jgi:hypothetical protein